SWWRMEGNADDEIGGNDGTSNGVQFIEDDERGKVASFDGDGDYISVDDDNSLDISTEFSILFWAKRNPFGYSALFDKGGYLWAWDLATANQNGGIDFRSNGFTNTDHLAYGIFDENKWTFFIITFDAGIEGENLICLKNGDEKISITNSFDNGGLYINTNNLLIGRGNSESPKFFNGTIDEVMIFNKALTADEVKAIYELDLS
ncbi:MAG: LamG domain-containing protein, partial [Nanoarchaeota archaeon]